MHNLYQWCFSTNRWCRHLSRSPTTQTNSLYPNVLLFNTNTHYKRHTKASSIKDVALRLSHYRICRATISSRVPNRLPLRRSCIRMLQLVPHLHRIKNIVGVTKRSVVNTSDLPQKERTYWLETMGTLSNAARCARLIDCFNSHSLSQNFQDQDSRPSSKSFKINWGQR